MRGKTMPRRPYQESKRFPTERASIPGLFLGVACFLILGGGLSPLAEGADGTNGLPGTNGAAETKTVTTASDLPSGAGLGGLGGNGTAGDHGTDGIGGGGASPFGDDGEPGGNGGNGGNGGSGGNGGQANITFNTSESLNIGAMLFGGHGGDAGAAGTGGKGGNGGKGLDANDTSGTRPPGIGGNGGNGGIGGSGANGGLGGNAVVVFSGGDIVFANGTQWGGNGGNGSDGVRGGDGGNGGSGGQGFSGILVFDGNDGGDGGNGGNSGNGGHGGNGGNATLTLHVGSVVFNSATFGGDGGDGGAGPPGGYLGEGGDGGDGWPLPSTDPGSSGNNGIGGSVGIGGNGGNGGNATFVVNGGTAVFNGNNVFGGVGGNGSGIGIPAGSNGVDGYGSFTVNSGSVRLDGNLLFQGSDSTMTVKNSATLEFSNNRSVHLGSGIFSFEDGSLLTRSSSTGVLSIVAGSVYGPTGGLIQLALIESGDFLSINATTYSLSPASFDLSGYRRDTMVTTNTTATGTVFSLQIDDKAMDLEWMNASGNGKWAIGNGNGGDNWTDGEDFYNADNALFRGRGRSTVEIVGTIVPGKVDVGGGSYTFNGNGSLMTNGTLSVSGGAALQLANTGTNRFGGGVTIANASLTITPESGLDASNINVQSGGILNLTATDSLTTAPIQGGTLHIAQNGSLNTTFADYTGMKVGETKTVFLAQDVVYQNAGTVTAEGGRLYTVSELFWSGSGTDAGNLYYTLTRLRSNFNYVAPGINGVYDGYGGGNSFLDYTLSIADDYRAARAVQSGFDIVNLSGGGSMLYTTVNRVLDVIRFQPRIPYSRRQVSEQDCTVRGQRPCDPCIPNACDVIGGDPCANVRTSLGTARIWGASLYMNAKAFGLSSGVFSRGYVDDQYAFVFGKDFTFGRDRVGIAGYGGWGHAYSTGDVLKTSNNTAFGGVYGYYANRGEFVDMKLMAGWSGMDNSLTQWNGPAALQGSYDNGLASVAVDFEKPFRFDNFCVVPMIGLQYGYYYQNRCETSWDRHSVLSTANTSANLVAMPIGVRLTHSMKLGWLTCVPELRVRYIANLGDTVAHHRVWAKGSDVSVLLTSSLADRDIGDFSFVLRAQYGSFEYGAEYGWFVSDHYRSQSVSGLIRVRY